MAFRRELMRGIERLNATTTVLQRARNADPLRGLWEAADVQWWWRKPRASDEVATPVWFDDDGPVAVAGLSAWPGEWQVDVFAVPDVVDEHEVWNAALDLAPPDQTLRLLVRDSDPLIEVAAQSGFEMTDELSGTTWMDAGERPPVRDAPGFTVVDRAERPQPPHPLISRNGAVVEERLHQCSLYDPTLDLSVLAGSGAVAGYALFWYDPVTRVGLLEPMRVEDEFQRRGLAGALIAHGLDRLVRKGATRLKVGFTAEPGRQLYLSTGFVQTSVDRMLVRTPL